MEVLASGNMSVLLDAWSFSGLSRSNEILAELTVRGGEEVCWFDAGGVVALLDDDCTSGDGTNESFVSKAGGGYTMASDLELAAAVMTGIFSED